MAGGAGGAIPSVFFSKADLVKWRAEPNLVLWISLKLVQYKKIVAYHLVYNGFYHINPREFR